MLHYFDIICSMGIVSLSALICTITPIRMVIINHNHVIPIRVIILSIGFLIGLIVYLSIGNEPHCENIWRQRFVLTMYLPVFIVNYVYTIDTHLFLQCLPAGIIIALSGATVYTLMVGFAIGKILHEDWTLLQGVFAGFVMLPMKPTYIILMLERLFKHKKLGATLQLESILTLLYSGAACAILFGYSTSILTEWYHFITIALRIIFFGMIIGYSMGRINVMLIGYSYIEPWNALTITVAIMFITFLTCEIFVYTSGIMAIITMAITLSFYRYRFSTTVNRTLILFYDTTQAVNEVIWFIRGCLVLTLHALQYFTFWSIYRMSFLYLTTLIVRMMQFALLSVPLKKLSLEMDVKCIVVTVLSDLKGVFNLSMIISLVDVPGSQKQFNDFSIDFLGYLLLSTVINCLTLKPIVKWLGVSNVPLDRIQNMSDIVLFLNRNTSDLISTLRTYRYMQNVQWKEIRKHTGLTNPYMLREEHEEETGTYYHYVHCNHCYPNVPFDVSEKELAFYISQSRKKILRAKKLVIYQQYLDGQTTKLVHDTLVHYVNQMVESKGEIDHTDLEGYLTKKKSLDLGMRFIKYVCPVDKTMPPNQPIRLLCYYLTMHIAYDFFFLALIIIYAILYGVFKSGVGIKIAYSLLWLFFCVDFKLKTIGLSRETLFFSGIKPYFRNGWNIYDFFLLVITSWNICAMNSAFYATALNWLIIPMRLVIVVRIVLVFCPHIYQCLDKKFHRQVLLGYELAAVSLSSCDEVLSQINILLEVQMMQDLFRKDLKMERMSLVQLMENVHRKWPWITTTVKTKKVISTTLNAMYKVLHELRHTGYISLKSYLLIDKLMAIQSKKLLKIRHVPSREGNVIFSEISWMIDDPQTIDYLYDNIEEVSWDPGEIVVRQGEHTNGIYILLTGMLTLKYRMDNSFIDADGCMPIVDFLNTPKIADGFEDTMIAGDVFGVIAFLTGRVYDCTIIADYMCEAYFVASKFLEDALKMNNDPINGLECRMWKSCMREITVALLMDQPQYMFYTKEQVRAKIDNAFMPNVKGLTFFIKTEHMTELLLLEGWVKDLYTDETFAGPMVLPQTIQRFLLISHKIRDITIYPRLMILYKTDANPYVIMEAVQTEVNETTEDINYYPVLSYIEEDLGYKRRYDILTRASNMSTPNYRLGRDKAVVVLASEESSIHQTHNAEASTDDSVEWLQRNTIIADSETERLLLQRAREKRFSEMSDLEEL